MEPTIRKGEESHQDAERPEEVYGPFPEEEPEMDDVGKEAADGENSDQEIDDNLDSSEAVDLSPAEASLSPDSEYLPAEQPIEEDQPSLVDEGEPNLANTDEQLTNENVEQSWEPQTLPDQQDLPVDESQPESVGETETNPLPAEYQTVEVAPLAANDADSLPAELESPLPEYPASQFTTDFLPIPALAEAPQEVSTTKIALVLSGGGARGAFQVGAEKYAREVKGYHWDIIAGVSVGALNGAMLAMHRFARLLELWDNLSDKQVYTGGFSLLSLVKVLFGAKSFYANQPLQRMMQHEFEAGRILDDLRVGTVSLISGEYVQFTKESLELSKAILASASIPVVFPPVDVSADHPAMVDGGVRNITPIGDVLQLEPDEIVIINCGNQNTPTSPRAAANVLSIGMRTLDIMMNEIFVNDMKQFLRINALVKEAESQGYVLNHPKTGKPYKYYPCQVIEPDGELGEVLDFSQKSVQVSIKAGVRRARQVLGRP